MPLHRVIAAVLMILGVALATWGALILWGLGISLLVLAVALIALAVLIGWE